MRRGFSREAYRFSHFFHLLLRLRLHFLRFLLRRGTTRRPTRRSAPFVAAKRPYTRRQCEVSTEVANFSDLRAGSSAAGTNQVSISGDTFEEGPRRWQMLFHPPRRDFTTVIYTEQFPVARYLSTNGKAVCPVAADLRTFYRRPIITVSVRLRVVLSRIAS